MASLFVIRGSNAGQHYSLHSQHIIIGRDASCDIQIIDHEVSRQHVEIVRDQDRYWLLDLASSNGSFLNGSRVSREELRSGDRMQLGRTLLVFNSQGSNENEFPDRVQSAVGVDVIHDKDLPQPAIQSHVKSPIAEPVIKDDTRENDPSVHPDGNSVSVIREKNHWEMMYRTVLAVSRTIDIDQLLAQILDLIFEWVHCDRGCIMLIHEESGQLRPAARKYRRITHEASRMEVSKSILDYVLRTHEGVRTSNAKSDGRWNAGASIEAAGIREAICVPMRGRYGNVGAIYIDTSRSLVQVEEQRHAPMFDDDHLKLMIAIGHQSALAVEDTFYYRGMLQAERLAVMGQTIANLSHHVKNILQGLHGGSYLVDEGLKREQIDTIARGWKIVEKNQERIAAMVMDMLTFSKERQPELASIDLAVTIEDCVELCRSRAGELGVELQWQTPDTFPKVMADAEAMHRAILNVIHNAIDAVSEIPNGLVRVSLSFDVDHACIDIEDNGVGIPEDDLKKIFSVFESSKGSRGTGLGLPVSQKILREHGGDIEVSSRLGEGSRFQLLIPNRPSHPLTEAIDQQPTQF